MRNANQGLCDTHTPGVERTRPRWGPAGDLASGAQVAGVACGGDWGAIVIFFLNTRTSSWWLVLFVYLLPKSTIRSARARARNPNRFFSALAVETLLPASDNRSNYSHVFFVETPRSSRYIAYPLDFNWQRRFCTKLTGTWPSPASMCGLKVVLPTSSLTGASPCSWGCPMGPAVVRRWVRL
jgi:hypothetical protein